MDQIDRRTFLAGAGAVAGAVAGGLALAGCSSDTPGPASAATTRGPGGTGGAGGPATGPTASTADAALAAPGTPGLIDEAVWQQRVDAYLAFASAEQHLDGPTGIAVHLIRAHRDPTYRWPVEQATVDGLSRAWEQIDTWQDTRDFTFMYLHWLLALSDGSSPSTTLAPELIAAIEQRMRDNRYRYDDPQPADRVDEQWFWSENHILIGHVIEYLAGIRMPDATFSITGMTGREHADRARPGILAWVDERARYGFFEWHSNVYLLKNISPLTLLAEVADDPELVAAAGLGLDLCLLDLAGHLHRGTFSATRGRTYKKDKMSARDEDVFGTSKLVFADTDIEYTSRTDSGATYLAAAKRYRPPQVLLDLATGAAPGVTRERHGIFVDGAAPVTPKPEAPFGFAFDDPANLPFWWSQGAVGMWQIAGISLSEAEQHRLFETKALGQVKLLADLNQRDPDKIRAWEQKNHAIVNFGHLREANTYAWRGDEVMLASVVDHRFGQMRDQIHSWQATIDADALVFTQHPTTGLQESLDWSDDPSPGYWTGEASVPRCGQFERTAVHIYQPAYDETTDDLLWSVFGYRPYTHAYVPQDRFDEVVQVDNWTIVRKGGGFIALWSWRAPTWREYDAAKVAVRDHSKPFDLVAEGGADNVWIVEVGEAADGTFEQFRAGVLKETPNVERTPAGFTVAWTSPSAGAVTFGSTGPLTVAGREVPLGDFPRHESAFGTVDRLATTYALRSPSSGAHLTLDVTTGTRSLGA